MATRSSVKQPLPVTLRDFLACSECGKGAEYMDDPVVLPCLHPICLDCLERRVRMSLCKKYVTCAVCTQRTAIPPGGLEAFPPDRFSRVAFKTLRDPEYIYLHGRPNPKCGLHPREEVSYYCHECQVQTCAKCVTSNHQKHSRMEDIATAANKMNQELVSSLHRSMRQVERSISELTDNWKTMHSDLDELSKQVKDRAQQLTGKIMKWEEHNLRMLQDTKQQQDQRLRTALEELEAQQSTLRQYKQYVDILHERGTDLDKTSHCPGLQELIHKQCKLQPEVPNCSSHDIVLLEDPLQGESLSRKPGNIRTGLSIFRHLKHKETVRVPCQYAMRRRLVTLFGQQHVLHSFMTDNYKNKICIHNTNGCIQRLLCVPMMADGCSAAVVDSSGGKLVVADRGMATDAHTAGCLHWITLNQAYEIIEHEITGVTCRPGGYVNVDDSGQVLVITRCTHKDHPSRLEIYDRNTHGQLQVVDLPDVLKFPRSAVNCFPGVFVVVDHQSKVVWLDHTGRVLKTYGGRPEEGISAPQHVVQLSEGHLLVSDNEKHALYLLSRDGTFLQYMLRRDLHQIEFPCAIQLDQQAGLLAVSCANTAIMVFSFDPQTDNAHRR